MYDFIYILALGASESHSTVRETRIANGFHNINIPPTNAMWNRERLVKHNDSVVITYSHPLV